MSNKIPIVEASGQREALCDSGRAGDAVMALPDEVQAPRRREHDERGMTTAEYAVGTIAAASFAGILIRVLTDPTIQALLLELLSFILRHFMQIPGV